MHYCGCSSTHIFLNEGYEIGWQLWKLSLMEKKNPSIWVTGPISFVLPWYGAHNMDILPSYRQGKELVGEVQFSLLF